MATLSDIYNKVKLGEDLAEKGMATTADYLTSNPELTSPYNTYGIASAVEANTSTNYNPLESLGTAASGFVRGVGGIPGLDKIAEPIASGIDQLHSEGYNASRIARQARNDSFDERNQTKYLSDLSEGKSEGMASLAKIGREAVNYFSNSNATDMVDDTAQAAGFLTGAYVLGGIVGKAIKGVYTGIASARLATTAEAKMAQYDGAIKLAESARAQALEKLGQANLSNVERETLTKQVAELDNTIKTASQELNDSIKSANLARNNLAAAEAQRDLYSSTSPLKNESLRDLRLNNGTLLSDEALARNVAYNQQKVAETTDALRANKAVLGQAQQEQSLIKDYLKADNKLNSLNKGKTKTKSLLDKANAEIEAKATKFSQKAGGDLVNFAYGASTALNNEDLDNVSLEDFKKYGSTEQLDKFNSIKNELVAKGLTVQQAEEQALDSLKTSLKASSAIKTGLWETAMGRFTGRASKQGQGLKGLLSTKVKDYAGETVEELAQTAGEDIFSNSATHELDTRKDITEGLGRDLAQTAFTIPTGMATVNAGNIAKKAGTGLTKQAYTVGSALAGAHTQNNIAKALDSTNPAKKVKLPSDLESRVSYSKNKESRGIITDKIAEYEADAADPDRDLSFITKIKESIKDHKDIIDTRNAILDEINHQTGIMKATTTSKDDREDAALNVVDLVNLAKGLNEVVTGGENPSKNILKFKKEYNRRLAEKIKDLELDKDIIPVLKKALQDEVSKLNLPENQSEELINQHLNKAKSKLSVASMLLNSDTSKEEVQALADMAQELTKMNPSYAKLPEAQVLHSKIELAKAYNSWLEKANTSFQGIYENVPDSAGKISKHDEGFFNKKSFKQYMTAVSDILNDANLEDKDTLTSLGTLHKNLQEFYSSQESKIQQVTKVLEDIDNKNLQGYNVTNNVLHYEGRSKGTYTHSFKLNISLTGENENGAYTPETTRERYLNPIQREQEIMIAIGSAVKGLKEALEGKPVSLEPKVKTNIQSNSNNTSTSTGNYGNNTRRANFRQNNGDTCKALAESFTEQDAGRDTKGNLVSTLTYEGPDEIPYTYTINKDTPPVRLQVNKNFYPYTGDNRIPHEKNSSSYYNGKYLQLAFKFASTYAIENEQERLKAQEELIDKAKNTKLINKLTNKNYAPKYKDFFTEESLKKAGIDPKQSVGFIGTDSDGSYKKITLYKSKELNYKFDFAEHIYSGILKENLAGKQTVSEPVSTNNNQNKVNAEKVNTEETKAVEPKDKDNVAGTTTNTEPTVTEDQLEGDIPSDPKEAVVWLNTINKGSFTFKDSNSKATDEVVEMILKFFNEDSEVAHEVAQAVNNIATNILEGLNSKLQFNLNKFTAEEFNSNGLFRFFTFEESNSQIIAKWATINGESVEGRVKAALALTLLSTAFTRDKRLNQLVEEFTESSPEAIIFAKDLSIKLNNKIDINWNQAMKELKDTPLVSLNSFGSVLTNYLRALIPATANARLTPSGGKYAHDTLTGTIINMFKGDYRVNGQSIVPTKGTEGNIHYFTIFHKKADKIDALGQVIALPNLSVKGKEKTSYRKSLKVANEDLAKLEDMPVDMHVGTEPLQSLGANSTLRHTKLKTSKSEANALKNLSEIPHEVTTYGNFVSKVSQSAYVEAMLPSVEYISEDASSAQRAKAEQLARAHTEVVDTKNLVEATQKESDKPVYIYYGNDYTKVHRLNASHYDSYRNNKTVREGIAPSKMQATMDTLRQNAKAFMLWKRAVVQGFGDKVQNITDISSIFEKYLNLVQQLPENQQKVLVDTFLNKVDGSKELDSAFIALGSLLRNNGIEVTEVALHNAVELLAYSAGENFKSSVYGEADGITNGIFFSMLMDAVYNTSDTVGLQKHITNLARVGMFLGINQDTDNPEHGFYGEAVRNLQNDSIFTDPDNTLPDLMVNGKTQDIYTTVATLVSNEINAITKANELKEPGEPKESLVPLSQGATEKLGTSLTNLTKFLLSYLNVKVNPNGTLEVSRQAVKLPVTQVNYSAGTKSIAESMSKELANVWNRGMGTKSETDSGIPLYIVPITLDELKSAGKRNLHLNKMLTDIVNHVVTMMNNNRTDEQIFEYLAGASTVDRVTILKAPFDAIRENGLVKEFVSQVKIQCAVGYISNCTIEYDEDTGSRFWNNPKTNDKGEYVYSNPLGLTKGTGATLDTRSLKKVSTLLKTGYVDRLFDTITKVLGEGQNSPLVKVIPLITEKVFQYKDKLTKQVYEKALKGFIKDQLKEKPDLIAMAHKKLPEREIKELNKQINDKINGILTQISPILGSESSEYAFTLFKSKRVEAKALLSNSPFTLSNGDMVRYSPEITVDDSGGVAARPNGNIGLGDGATMTDAINLMHKLKIHFQDIFDGINLSALTYADKENINQLINKIASYKALHTNPILGFIQVWNNIKDAFTDGSVINRMSGEQDKLKDEIKAIESGLAEANKDISVGHAILNSGVIPFTCNQYAFNPEGAYSKRPEFTVGDATYTYTQDLTIEQTSAIYSYLYGVANSVFNSMENKEEAHEKLPALLAEAINKDTKLLKFLESNGVTVVPLTETKPASKPKPKKTLKDLNIKKRMAKVEYDDNGYCNAVNLLKNDLLTSSKDDKKRIAYHALLKLLRNKKLLNQKVLILSRAEVEALDPNERTKILSNDQYAVIHGLTDGNAVFIPNDTKEEYKSVIVYNGNGTSEQETNDLIMHELFHAMFKRTLYSIFGNMRLNQLFDNNGRIRVKDIIAELVVGLDQTGRNTERDLTTLLESINAMIDESKTTKSDYVAKLRSWVGKNSGLAVDFIDELCMQSIMPTDSRSKQIKKDYGFLAHIADLLLISKDTLSNILQRIWDGISARRGKANPGAILLSLVSLSNFRSIDFKSELRKGTNKGKKQLRHSYAFIPTNEDLQQVLETKPEKFNRLVKAFSYNDNNHLQELLTQYEDDDGNSKITLDQATKWAMYDDIVKNKAMSDMSLLTLSKIHDALIKSEEFKHISPDIQELLIGHVGNVANASFGRKTETSPIANMMFLAEISPEVQDLMSKVKLPDALKNKLNYAVDRWINDTASKAYNSLLNKATVSERYDHLLAKICSDNATASMAGKVLNTASQIENRANSLVHNMLSAGVGKVASNIAKHTKEGAVHSLASAVALVHEADKTHDLTDTLSFLGTLTTQAINLPNAAMHLLQDISSANVDNFEPLAFFKKTKAQFDKIKNQIAKEVPANIKAEFKSLTKEEEAVLNNVVLKLDLSCLLPSGSAVFNLQDVIENNNAKDIAEDIMRQISLNNEQIKRIRQLAHYLATGKTGGEGLLRNAYAIAHLTKTSNGYMLDPSKTVTRTYVTNIDRIISLLALTEVPAKDLDTLHGTITRNFTGMKDFIDFHKSIKNQDLRTMENDPQLMFNYNKGYIPQNISNQVSVQVVTSAEKAQELSKLGYSLVKIINRNPGDHSLGKLYLMKSALPEAAYRQGIIKQNNVSRFGLANSGFDKDSLLSIKAENYKPSDDNLKDFNPIPVFNANGVVTGYSMDFSSVLADEGISKDTNPFGSLGIWHGNAFTFEMSKSFNLQLVKLNAKMLANDISKKSPDLVEKAWRPISEYTSKDRVIADAWSHVPAYVKEAMAKEQNCSTSDILIRRDMIDLFLGYRTASVTDFFTGISRWSPKTCNTVAKLALKVLGKDAYKYLAGAERAIQYTSAYARSVIVVRSVVVPFCNICSNILQLRMRGIPLEYIAEKIATKTLEAEQYNTLLNNQLKIRAKIATFPDPNDQGAIKLKRRLEIIEDKIGLLSINPMIEAGELSTINDVGDDYNQSVLTGTWADKLNEEVGKLPDSVIQAGKWLTVSKDTAMYKILEKATIYGDFVAKSIYYDWLTEHGTQVNDALIKSMNEFVNYDMLAGRNREYLENLGVIMFYNYTLRSLRTAFDIMLHNPVSALLSLYLFPDFMTENNVFTDSFIGKLAGGRLGGTFMNPSLMAAPITKNPFLIPMM